MCTPCSDPTQNKGLDRRHHKLHDGELNLARTLRLPVVLTNSHGYSRAETGCTVVTNWFHGKHGTGPHQMPRYSSEKFPPQLRPYHTTSNVTRLGSLSKSEFIAVWYGELPRAKCYI
eukprot:3889215-Amphidinium_carterae.3